MAATPTRLVNRPSIQRNLQRYLLNDRYNCINNGEPGPTPEPFANADRRDLFLSYNSSDRASVMKVRTALSVREVSAFYDRADLNPGQPWFDELEAALRQVCGVAVFIGRHGLGTIQKREVQFALNRQASEAPRSNGNM